MEEPKLIKEKVIRYYEIDDVTISIETIDGKFSKAEYPFSGFYNKHEWEILKELAKLVKKIG